jgi:hypothetical protein
MTLIVAVTTQRYAIHASDRYVSVQPTPKHKSPDWDLNANKTVIAVGSDCWLVLGYSGLAYLDGKPTDQLIAEAISGFDDLSGKAGMVTQIGRKDHPHYRAIRDQIEKKIGDAYSRIPLATANTYGTSVLASGVQRKDNQIMGVMFQIAVAGTSSGAIELAPHRLQRNQFMMRATGTVDNSIIEKARQRIAALTNLFEPYVIRDILIEAVAETGKVCDAVGEDVMGVVLDKRSNTISTVFRSPKPERLADLLQQTRLSDERYKQMASVSTPYVITPEWTFFPSIGTPGGWTNPNSGIKFEYEGFDSKPLQSKTSMFFTGQPRRKPPT